MEHVGEDAGSGARSTDCRRVDVTHVETTTLDLEAPLNGDDHCNRALDRRSKIDRRPTTPEHFSQLSRRRQRSHRAERTKRRSTIRA